jgi:hypothetical protein
MEEDDDYDDEILHKDENITATIMIFDKCKELKIAYLESRFLWSFAQILLWLVVHFTGGG